MLVFLEHHDARALAHDKAVAVLVVGARGLLRRLVEAGRKRACRTEAGHCQPADRRFGSARDHHLGIAERDQARRIADRMRAGRARRHDRMIGPLQPVLDRDIAGGKVDQAAGNEERRHFSRSPLLEQDRGVGNAGQPADAGADQRPGGATLFFGLGMPVRVVERLLGRAHREDDEIIDLALILRLHPLIGIEGAVRTVAARNHAGDLAGEIGDVERLDLAARRSGRRGYASRSAPRHSRAA